MTPISDSAALRLDPPVAPENAARLRQDPGDTHFIRAELAERTLCTDPSHVMKAAEARVGDLYAAREYR